MKSVLALILTLAALAAVKGNTEDVVEVGSEVKIPCDLKGPQLKWYWIPQYPICAGVKGEVEAVAIFSIGASQEDLVFQERFQHRATWMGQRVNGSSILILRAFNMDDSGTFYCSDGSKDSSRILITVKFGSWKNFTVQFHNESHHQRLSVTFSCVLCKENKNTTWTLNGKDAGHADIQKRRNGITIKSLSSRFYGLWKCSSQACPGQFHSYCLENTRSMSRKEGHKEITRTPNTTSSAGNTVHPHTIGACVAVLLGFLLLGAVVFIICRRRRSRRTSATTREPATDGSKQPTVVEGSPNRRDTEDPGLDDHSSIEGAEGMQYSTLEFKKSGEHSFSEAPAVIYAEIPTSK